MNYTEPQVADWIGSFGPAYAAYRNTIIDNGVNGVTLIDTVVNRVTGREIQDSRTVLATDLNITNDVHINRIVRKVMALYVQQ